MQQCALELPGKSYVMLAPGSMGLPRLGLGFHGALAGATKASDFRSSYFQHGVGLFGRDTCILPV